MSPPRLKFSQNNSIICMIYLHLKYLSVLLLWTTVKFEIILGYKFIFLFHRTVRANFINSSTDLHFRANRAKIYAISNDEISPFDMASLLIIAYHQTWSEKKPWKFETKHQWPFEKNCILPYTEQDAHWMAECFPLWITVPTKKNWFGLRVVKNLR